MAQSSKNLSLFPGVSASPPTHPATPATEAHTTARASHLWLAVCLHELVFEASGIARSHEPAVIADGDETHVAAATPAAQALGIVAGQALNAALAMADSLRIEPRDMQREQHALRSLAVWARTLTPTVSIVSPDVLLLEIQGSLKLFGGTRRIKAAVRTALAKRGLSARVSLAPSAQAATWLARHVDQDVTDVAQLYRALRRLPLRVTDWPHTLLERLSQMGIRSIGDLLRLPRDGLALRIGRARMQELDRAVCRAFEQRAVEKLPETRHRCIELPAETYDEGLLKQACEKLIAPLSAQLQQQHKQISRFVVHFRHLRRDTSCETFELLAPSCDRQRLLDLLFDRLERITLPAPVISVELYTGELHDLFVETPELFTGTQRRDADTGMVERLRERCGPKSVYSIALAEDHRPESAWSMQYQPACAQTPPSPWAAERPLWLLPQPQLYSAQSLQIELGPERIESGWWDGHAVNRDYYTARSGSGERLWVYFDHRECKWYLHGVFG